MRRLGGPELWRRVLVAALVSLLVVGFRGLVGWVGGHDVDLSPVRRWSVSLSESRDQAGLLSGALALSLPAPRSTSGVLAAVESSTPSPIPSGTGTATPLPTVIPSSVVPTVTATPTPQPSVSPSSVSTTSPAGGWYDDSVQTVVIGVVLLVMCAAAVATVTILR